MKLHSHILAAALVVGCTTLHPKPADPASMTLTIPDAKVDKLAEFLGWPAAADTTGDEQPDFTKAQFIRRGVRLLILHWWSQKSADEKRAASAADTLGITVTP